MQGVFFAAQKTGLLPTVEPTRLCQAGALHGQYVGQFGAMHGPCARRVGALRLLCTLSLSRRTPPSVAAVCRWRVPRLRRRWAGLWLPLQGASRLCARHVCKMYRGTARSAHKTIRGTARHEKSSLSQCCALTTPNAGTRAPDRGRQGQGVVCHDGGRKGQAGGRPVPRPWPTLRDWLLMG